MIPAPGSSKPTRLDASGRDARHGLAWAAIELRMFSWLRRRATQLLLTAILIGLLAGLVIGLAAGARRTSTAPDRYTAAAGGDPDVLITQLSGPPLTAKIASISGVDAASSWAFVTSFLVSPTDGAPVLEPNPFAGNDRLLGARLVAGRFADPTHPDEFTANRSFAALLAQRFGTRVGDRFQVTSFDQQQVATNAFDTGEAPAVPDFTATLVGITETPGDFDDSSPAMVFSESFLAAHPAVGVVQTLIAVDLDAGTDPTVVIDAVRRMPDGADAYNAPIRIVSADARRAVGFQVTALWLITAFAAAATAAVALLLVGRMLRMAGDERAVLIALGWRRRELAIERALLGAVTVLIGAPVAALAAYMISDRFPLGVLRLFEPARGRHIDWVVTSVGITLVSVVVVGIAAGIGLRGEPRRGTVRPDATLRKVISATGAGMPLSAAAAMTASDSSRGRRPVGVLLVGGLGIAGIVGAFVAGISLTHIIDTQSRWGVNYDQLFGNPYIPTAEDIVTPVLTDPNVRSLTGATIGSLTLDGSDTPTFAFDAAKGDLVPTVLRGRVPATDGEIGLGAEVARQLGVGVGDHVEAVGATGIAHEAKVVGIVVTPDSAGDGAAVTFATYASLNPTATENVILVEFDGSAPPNAADGIAAANFSPPGALTVPTSVRSLERVTAAPFLLGIFLIVLSVTAYLYLLSTAVRSHRHDLATLRALGSSRRQLRAVLHWQATVVTTRALVVGVPLGIILGRRVVALMTDALGIVPGAEVPISLITGAVIGSLLVANVLAMLPALQASRASANELTRR